MKGAEGGGDDEKVESSKVQIPYLVKVIFALVTSHLWAVASPRAACDVFPGWLMSARAVAFDHRRFDW